MPSAKKNDITKKGVGATATSARSQGSASKSGKAARPVAATSDGAKTSKSAAKSAKTAAKTRVEAPVTTAAKATTKTSGKSGADAAARSAAASGARASALAKNVAARGTVAAAPGKAGAKTVKSAAKTAATAAVKSDEKITPAKAHKTAASIEKPKPVAKPAAAPASEKAAPEKALATAPARKAEATRTSEPVTSAAAHKPAPAAAVAPARDAKPPFPAKPAAPAAAAAAGKTSSTTTAGEDKKLAKRNEPPVETATPVAAEKTVTDSKAVVRPAPAKTKPAAQKHGFKLNEFIVYPAHGVGQIIGVETQEVAGFSLELFVVSFIKDKMILKVPTSKIANVGMRKLAETGVVDKALTTLSGRARIKRTMWSRRAQEYEAKINSGDLVTIAEVVRDLYRSDTQPEQSYSERQLYEAALDRMAREVAAVRKLIDSEALKVIESFLQKGPRRGAKADAEAEAADDGDEEDVDRAA
ncbi:hypothetical protein SS37A_22580 [Methylocystis iwaonis]|uniref:CarD-like/TRCF RNAP-interacting domain-containing protein n=1 Tax=Methylocystis iwaonis TaxID=2885079 RepID=A0ABM8E9S3_9HYPH|nr:hypothetical protein SS37A_22580 [Methylocystis iwaonis]